MLEPWNLAARLDRVLRVVGFRVGTFCLGRAHVLILGLVLAQGFLVTATKMQALTNMKAISILILSLVGHSR